MKYNIFLVLTYILFTVNLSAKTYENAEDKRTSRWQTLKASSASIKNIFDKSKNSRVIEFKGEGTKSAYLLKINQKRGKKLLHWEMKYSEDFVIFVSLDTKLGKRYLIYTPGNKNSYMEYGLGKPSSSGKWQKYTRNLEEDLRYFDNRNSIIKVNSFVIRGSGRVDNIKTIKPLTHKVIKNTAVKKVKNKNLEKRPLIKKKSLRRKNRARTNIMPKISINGANPLFLSLGETFIEPGVSATDNKNGKLIVTSSENINNEKDGKYVVIYMATDSMGNTAVDKRYVIIGDGEKVEKQNDKKKEIKKEEKSPEEEFVRPGLSVEDAEENGDIDEAYRIEKRELEISNWERDLQRRELQYKEKDIS